MAHSTRTVIFRYVFITSGSPYCSRYFSAARVRSGCLIVTSKRCYSIRATAAVTSPLSPLLCPPTWPEKRLAVMVGILNKNKTGDKAEHEETWHDDNQSLRRIDIHRSAGQIGDEQMTHHAHGGCGNDLIELKSEKCLEPSPEEKVSFIEHHPGNEHWAEEANNCRADRSVGDDHCDQSSKNAQDELNGICADEACKVR